MHEFFEALISKNRHTELPEEFDYFGKLIGSWSIEYVDNHNSQMMKGEWHFARILDGMAIQDVIKLPDYECGTTIRMFNKVTKAWDIVYCYADKIMRFEAKKQKDKIVLTNIDDANRKWVFMKIEDNEFHWQDIYVNATGEWQVKFDLFAKRI